MVMEYMAGKQIMSYSLERKIYEPNNGNRMTPEFIKKVMVDILSDRKSVV